MRSGLQSNPEQFVTEGYLGPEYVVVKEPVAIEWKQTNPAAFSSWRIRIARRKAFNLGVAPMRMRIRLITVFVFIAIVGLILSQTHNQIRGLLAPKPPVMSERVFWKIVDTARKDATTDDEIRAGLLRELKALSTEDVIRFGKRYNIFVGQECFTHKIWNAIYLINGGCGDDSFHDFRDYLVMRGEDEFRRIVNDPDTLLDSNMNNSRWQFSEMNYFGTIYELNRPEIDELLQNPSRIRSVFAPGFPVRRS